MKKRKTIKIIIAIVLYIGILMIPRPVKEENIIMIETNRVVYHGEEYVPFESECVAEMNEYRSVLVENETLGLTLIYHVVFGIIWDTHGYSVNNDSEGNFLFIFYNGYSLFCREDYLSDAIALYEADPFDDYYDEERGIALDPYIISSLKLNRKTSISLYSAETVFEIAGYSEDGIFRKDIGQIRIRNGIWYYYDYETEQGYAMSNSQVEYFQNVL